ncbi:hypothetical protein [Pseudomonas fragi]|uniref:Transmembrane protein n=1 Tax=Pseudomonas fragi TaxID=296 RepID=A0A9Q5AZK1_PSEFR|nr:hypothetical protein [Pseudomonas fragi]NNB49530.1 hypothetical protein [Pseudomonas fragi]
MNEQLFVLTSRKRTTSHVLHLLLCIPTLGVWLIVWLVVISMNSSHNKKIDRQIDRIVQYKVDGLSDSDTFKQNEVDNADDDAFHWKVGGCRS